MKTVLIIVFGLILAGFFALGAEIISNSFNRQNDAIQRFVDAGKALHKEQEDERTALRHKFPLGSFVQIPSPVGDIPATVIRFEGDHLVVLVGNTAIEIEAGAVKSESGAHAR